MPPPNAAKGFPVPKKEEKMSRGSWKLAPPPENSVKVRRERGRYVESAGA
jgi:hypothetical protein